MKYVFYITDIGITAYDSTAKPGDIHEFFDWNDIALLDDFLSTVPEKAEADVVLDLVEEDLYFEWSPKVHSWEKGSIAKRRKERLQSESIVLTEVRWTDATRISEDGRKEELLLSATITDSFNVSSFLEALENAQIIVTGIHSKAFLLEEYFKKSVREFLKLSRPDAKKPFLLVTRRSENTYRQTFFYDGDLRLSRLIELDQKFDSIDEVRKALVDETKLAITYVYNQKIVPYNSPIGYVFLDGEDALLEGMLEQCLVEGLIRDSWDKELYFVAVANFREISGDSIACTNADETCYSPQAVVDFIFAEKPKGFYHIPYVNKVNNLIAGKRLFVGINVLLFLSGLYYVLITGVDTLVSWQKQALLEQSIKEHDTEAKRLQEMVKLQDDAQKIKDSVEFSEAILKLKVNRLINFDVNALSKVIANHRNIQLVELGWRTLDRFDSDRNQIDINAWVFPFYETYHDPVKWVDDFVRELQSIDGVEMVELQKEPLNRKLSQSLSISSEVGDVNALPFTVTLRVKDVEPK